MSCCCSGVAKESHLIVPAAVPAFILFSPVRPGPLVRMGGRCPWGSWRSPGQATGSTKPGSSRTCTSGTLPTRQTCHLCCECLAWAPQPLESGVLGWSGPFLTNTISQPSLSTGPHGSLSSSCPIASLRRSPFGKGGELGHAGHFGEPLALGSWSHMWGTHSCVSA